MPKLRMLAACEMSGRVAAEFARRGWEAWSCDLLPSQTSSMYCDNGGTYRHYQGDVRDLLVKRHPVNYAKHLERQHYVDRIDGRVPLWDLVIAFPPCTDLSLAGARYWKEKQADGRQAAGAAFFMEMVNVIAPHVAVENPVGIMGRRKNPLYRVPNQAVQPWMFGDPLIKKTCLWLKGLPLLAATHDRGNYESLERVATGGGSYRVDKALTGQANNGHEDSLGRKYRTVMRGLTPPGLARAMAGQWGAFIEGPSAHNHFTRGIKPAGQCPGCDF